MAGSLAMQFLHLSHACLPFSPPLSFYLSVCVCEHLCVSAQFQWVKRDQFGLFTRGEHKL